MGAADGSGCATCKANSGAGSRPNCKRPGSRPAAAFAQPLPADLTLPALVVPEERRRRRHRVGRRLDEVPRDQGDRAVHVVARDVAQERARRQHGLDVEAVAPGADQQEERVEPGCADDRPVPVAEPGAPVPVASGRCRRGRRCGRPCRPRPRRRTPKRAPRPRRDGRAPGAAAGRRTSARRRPPARPPRCPAPSASGGGVSSRATVSSASRHASRSSARQGRSGCRLSTYSMHDHDPLVVQHPPQPRGRHRLGQRGQLARLLAVGRGEHRLCPGGRGLHEVAAAVLAGRGPRRTPV